MTARVPANGPQLSPSSRPPRIGRPVLRFTLGPSGKAEASPVRPSSPRSPRLVESCDCRSLLCGQYTRSGLFLYRRRGACCGLFDQMSDGLRLRHVHGVAAFDLYDR